MAVDPKYKFDRYVRSIPKVYKPGENPVITAFLNAFAGSSAEVCTQIQNTKDQLFVRTAEGQNLDRLANSLGVSRPGELGLDDPTFQELIPNLSLKPKQIRKAFYDTGDVFWGVLFSRTNIQTLNFEPFNISPGEEIIVQIDNNPIQTVKILTSEVAIPGAATAEEVAAILSKIKFATASTIQDRISNNYYVNLRTNTPGPLGSITIFDSSAIGVGKIEFDLGKTELRDQAQRFMIYQINPNELIIEIPAVVPSLRRVLKGSHHFHADSTIESPIPPANGVWQGSFFFNPQGNIKSFSITGQSAKLDVALQKNNVYTNIVVDDTTNILNPTGSLVFGYGTEREEQPVKYRGIPNSKTILIDPSYIFQFNHPVNEYINVLFENQAFKPAKDGSDLPIYLTSPANARAVVQEILDSLKAAGITITFVILAPEYKYIIDNPYLFDDDAPGEN